MADTHDKRCDETGICSIHKVEIERRKSDRRELSELKTQQSIDKAHIAKLLSFKNRLLGVGLLGSIILLGSYGYINSHIRASDVAHAKLVVKNEIFEQRLSKLEGAQRVDDEKFRSVMKESEKLNDLLGQMIQRLAARNSE